MTTYIGARTWTYYEKGKYPCTCFFCKDRVETVGARWYSPQPSSLYACNRCMEQGAVRPEVYPEAGQAQFDEKKDSQPPVNPQNAREERIAKAHKENMNMAALTITAMKGLETAIGSLTVVLGDLVQTLKEGQK